MEAQNFDFLSKKSARASFTELPTEKEEVKLEKNRVSAQKSRQEKKVYVNTLEDKLKSMEEELKSYKMIISKNKSSIETKIESLKKKENEYTNLLSDCPFTKSEVLVSEERRKLNFDYTKIQSGLISELFKK